MKKFLVCLIGIIFIFTASVYPSNQWQEGIGQDTILGNISPSDIDKDSFENIVNPLDRMLANYQADCSIEYLSASTLTVKAGEVMLSNSDGSIRLMQQNTSDITVTWGDIDTDEEASSTTYYVYAFQETVTTATFSVTISTNASAPSGKTYYARLGSFYNNSSSNIEQVKNDNAHLLLGTGTIAHGGTIPLPSGYVQSQCKWMVSVNDQSANTDSDACRKRIYCSVTSNRVVTIQTVGDDETTNGIANYIIIGYK